MFMYFHQYTGRNKTRVEKHLTLIMFICLGTTMQNQNYIHEEGKSNYIRESFY
jgi:hypothetical protein